MAINRRMFAAGGGAALGIALAKPASASPADTLLTPPTRSGRKTHVTILLYEGVTMLDWVGPYEALHRVDGIELVLAGKHTDFMKSDSGLADYRANIAIGDVKETDVLVIPGGAKGMMDAANDPVIAAWVRSIDKYSIYTIGICTGSLLLAHLGLLEDRRATTYWKFTPMLVGGGATFVPERWVRDGKYWTCSGVSAGIDVTLALIADLYGPKSAMMAQLAIEYDPHPPYNAGSVRTAPKDVIDALGGLVAPKPAG